MPKYAKMALISLLLTAAGQTLQAADPERLNFGALHFGMSPVIVTRSGHINPDDLYTDTMRRLKTGADVTLLCKVQEDGSVLCDIKPGTPSPGKNFTDAALKLGERLEVETKLRDGTPAIGGLIERRIRFPPPEAG